MNKEKIQQAISLLQECLEGDYEEESDEGEDMSESSYPSGDMGGESANDKVKMAAAMMKRR